MRKPLAVASSLEHSGRVIQVSTERLRYANGREYDIDFVRHPGAAAVVAVDGSRRVCLVRQYRHGVADFLWEIPAGKLDAGEPPEVCAVRELKEETGVTAARWTSLGLYIPAPGIFTEVIHLYLARDLDVGAAAVRMPMRNWNSNGCPSTRPSTSSSRASGMTAKPRSALWRAQHQLQM